MPKNNNLEPIKLPMDIKFGKGQKTKFKNNLDFIRIEPISYMNISDLFDYIPSFVDATWSENPRKKYSYEEAAKLVTDMFTGKTLPGALETINFVFRISGISLQEVTHIIRHRNATFSADCSGDKWWSEKDALVPCSIQNSPEFNERYEKLVIETKQLYCDMIDSKVISIMDARYILPRCLDTFYYMRINYKDLIAFINQRKDVQIQPETDNVIAYKLFDILLNIYGDYVKNAVDFSNPSPFYQKMARTGKATNLYFPEPEVDNFEYNEADFIYQCRRKDLNGTNPERDYAFGRIQLEYFKKFKKAGVKVPEWVN